MLLLLSVHLENFWDRTWRSIFAMNCSQNLDLSCCSSPWQFAAALDAGALYMGKKRTVVPSDQVCTSPPHLVYIHLEVMVHALSLSSSDVMCLKINSRRKAAAIKCCYSSHHSIFSLKSVHMYKTEFNFP